MAMSAPEPGELHGVAPALAPGAPVITATRPGTVPRRRRGRSVVGSSVSSSWVPTGGGRSRRPATGRGLCPGPVLNPLAGSVDRPQVRRTSGTAGPSLRSRPGSARSRPPRRQELGGQEGVGLEMAEHRGREHEPRGQVVRAGGGSLHRSSRSAAPRAQPSRSHSPAASPPGRRRAAAENRVTSGSSPGRDQVDVVRAEPHPFAQFGQAGQAQPLPPPGRPVARPSADGGHHDHAPRPAPRPGPPRRLRSGGPWRSRRWPVSR